MKKIKISRGQKIIKYILAITIFGIIGIFSVSFFSGVHQVSKGETVDVRAVDSEILASGTVDSQNKVNLNFQTGGKLVYLPFKEGDTVYQGQVIASLDTYILRKQLEVMANNYQIAKNAGDQALELQKAGVLEGQQRTSLDSTNKQGYSTIPEVDVIYDNVKRIVNNALIAQNSAQINIDIANYAIQLASIVSPINGVIMREDVTTPGVNITPATSFVIADPSSMVFSANVRQQDIEFISIGNSVKIMLDGHDETIIGTVDKIYPQKTILQNGESVYKIDIKAYGINQSTAKIGQSGTALIKSNFKQKVILVPSWTILSQNFVWVIENDKYVLKKVTVGDTINNQTEIMKGLSKGDKVIIDPKSIISKKYKIL